MSVKQRIINRKWKILLILENEIVKYVYLYSVFKHQLQKHTRNKNSTVARQIRIKINHFNATRDTQRMGNSNHNSLKYTK